MNEQDLEIEILKEKIEKKDLVIKNLKDEIENLKINHHWEIMSISMGDDF